MRGYAEPRGYLALVAVVCFTIILILTSTFMDSRVLRDAWISLHRFANGAAMVGSVVVGATICWFAFGILKGGPRPTTAGTPECGFYNAQPLRPSAVGRDSISENNDTAGLRIADTILR
jgi:hypothetical protein